MDVELDPRWDWIEIVELGRAVPMYVRGVCKHLELEPVDDVAGERVAVLCVTCDTQLPAETVIPAPRSGSR